MVRLDLDTNDYGIHQVTGRRGWLKLVEPKPEETEPVIAELVFNGKPGTTTKDDIKAHFENAWEEANTPYADGYVVTDLRHSTSYSPEETVQE